MYSSINKNFLSIILVTIGIFIGYYLALNGYLIGPSPRLSIQPHIERIKNALRKDGSNLSPNVHIVDLTTSIKTNFQCIQTKKLLGNISTHLCLYSIESDAHVSAAFLNTSLIYEEYLVIRILQYLIRHPHLHFIDIGANIGTYTLFVAALGRFVLAIECFAPNVDRLQRGIQLSNVTNQVVIVQNAIYIRSGEYLRLQNSTDNIGGQGLQAPDNRNDTNKQNIQNSSPITDPYIVKTITFDEVLPILVKHGIRSAVIKMDIEGSESFVVESGNKVFDTIDIPLVQMEWFQIENRTDRAKIILEFFSKRNYNPVNISCAVLDVNQSKQWPFDIFWIKKDGPSFC